MVLWWTFSCDLRGVGKRSRGGWAPRAVSSRARHGPSYVRDCETSHQSRTRDEVGQVERIGGEPVRLRRGVGEDQLSKRSFSADNESEIVDRSGEVRAV